MLFDTNHKFLGDAIAGTATKNTTTSFDYEMPASYMIYGAELIYTNATDGDYISMEIVDKNNILGYGANFVLNEWIKKWYIPFNDNSWRVVSRMAGTIPEGLFIRLKYTSVGLLVNVPVKLNFFMIVPG